MRLEDMREQFPKMPESMKRMIEQEVAVQIGQEKENKHGTPYAGGIYGGCSGTCNNGLCRCCLPDA